MTPADRLQRLLDYDLWANLKVLAILENHESFEKRDQVLGLYYHIIATQQHWHGRVVGADLPDLEIWPELELDECRGQIESNYKKLKTLISRNEDNLDRSITYTNSSGTEFNSLLSDILHHLIIHGQHHRSQISMLLRMSEIAPPPTDFIFYTRENS